MPLSNRLIEWTPKRIVSAILAAIIGIYHLIYWTWLGGGFYRYRTWTPLVFFLIGIFALLGALGFLVGHRWGFLPFLAACGLLLFRTLTLLTAPLAVTNSFALLEFLIALASAPLLTVAALLILGVMWFQPRRFSILGLTISALTIVPSLLLAMFVVLWYQ